MLIDFFDKGVKNFPDKIFVQGGLKIATYREAWSTSNKIARYLINGVLHGKSHASVLSPNCGEALICMLGIFRAGFTWVPLNNRNLVDDHINFLNLTEVSCLFYHSVHRGIIKKIIESVPSIETAICIDSEDVDSLNNVINAFSGEKIIIDQHEDDTCTLFSTGGTTGQPKAAIWTHKTWKTLVANYLASIHYSGDQNVLVVTPITHAACIISFATMVLGATNYIAQSTEPEEILQSIECFSITTLFLPPTVIYMMLASEKINNYNYSSLQNFVYAAAPMSRDKLQQAIEVFGPVMVQTYGQAEAPMVCAVLNSQDHIHAIDEEAFDRLGSCGRETLLTQLAILGEDGAELPCEEVGEISVQGDLVMKGYYNNPGETAHCKTGPWHRTGDLGFRDRKGFFYITDRKRDMIITGGFNVFPNEIEQIIWSHHTVQDCAVIGIPDGKWGECVTAVVEPKKGVRVNEEEIIALCRKKLGVVKSPKKVFVWSELPRSAVGKVMKRSIRDHFWKDSAGNI